MAHVEELVRQARAAHQAGQKDRARDLLLTAVEQDEHHEEAWLWLSGLVESLEEQQICLENVLALNPANERAQKGLAKVREKIAARGSASEPPAGPGPGAPPYPTQNFAEEEFEQWLANRIDQPETPPAPKGDAPATSVEWSRTDKPAIYGSGRDVELPSENEYDAWVQGLHLPGDEEAAPPPFMPEKAAQDASPFVFDDFSAFGDTSAMVESSPFVPGSEYDADDRTFDFDALRQETSAWQGETPAFTFEDEPPPAESPPAYRLAPPTEPAPPAVAPRPDFSFQDESAGLDFSFDEGSARPDVPASAPAFAAPSASAAPRQTDYFQYIPADVTADAGRSMRRTLLLLGAFVLLSADVAAAVALVSAL